MKRLVICAALALLAVPACVLHIGSDDWGLHGASVSESTSAVNGHMIKTRDGELFMDETRLSYSRWVEADLSADPGAAVHVQTASGPIVLQGAEGQPRFSVLMWSEFEGDGRIVLENGELMAQGTRGKAFIDEVRGQFPRGLLLRADSGTGDVQLRGFAGSTGLDLGSGTGDLLAEDCAAATLHARSGTGDVRVQGGSGKLLDLASGTGDVSCHGARFGQASLRSGTGDLAAIDCDFERLQASSGTGDATVRGGHIGELHHELGVGDLDLN